MTDDLEFVTVKGTFCRCCETRIGRGDWAYEDGYRNVFCSDRCAKEFHEIKEAVFDE